MPVIKMNVPCKISTIAKFDVYGEPIISPAIPSVCAVVKFVTTAASTTVRTDSSATRGNAEELTASVILLLSKKVEPQIDNLITLRGTTVRVISVQPRYDVMGRLDHYQIGCSIER